jgi:GcrA cell cycle regulator
MTIATWTPERIAQLRSFVDSGLTCSQIAAEIGITRNAVIGKIHRLGLSPGRPAAQPARANAPRGRRPRLPTPRQTLRLVCTEAPGIAAGEVAESEMIDSAQRCSLLELTQNTCRWPVSDPDAADFSFCGNEAHTGFPYCAAHARMAYRFPARRRA